MHLMSIATRGVSRTLLKTPHLGYIGSAGVLYLGQRNFGSSAPRYHGQEWQATSGDHVRPNMGSPSLRRCIVTGGASGIGYQISKQLILSGASAVTIVSRSAAKAHQAIESMKKETEIEDAPLNFVECDFKDISDVSRELKASKQKFDTLINCAGVSQTQGLLTTSSATVSEILKINLQAPIELSRQMLKEYFAYGKSLSKDSTNDNTRPPSFCVVNISSLLAERAGYGTSVYSASKAGLTAFTRTLVLEAAGIRDKFPALPPFRANVVVPGYINTPMIENFSSAQKEKLVADIPLRRYGKAEEVADAVMFLLGNEYANNTVLNLDGALSAV